MDQEDELRKFKWILTSGLVFLISGCFSYTELKYAIKGQLAEAQVLSMKETVSTGRRRTPRLLIEYSFKEQDGTGRHERDEVSASWTPPTEGPIKVQYLPGVADSSRMEGNANTGAVYIFFVSLAVLGFSFFKVWKMAREYATGTPQRRRKK